MKLRARIRQGSGITPKGLDAALGKTSKYEQWLRLAKIAAFSNNSALREVVSKDLVEEGNLRYLIQVAQRVNRKNFSDKFFAQKLKFGEYPIKSIKPSKRMVKDFYGSLKKGPVSKFRGFEVYEVPGLEQSGILYFGKIFVDKDYPQKLKPVVCAHEVGEIFSHEVGIALELIEVKKRKLEKEYLKSLEDMELNEVRERYSVCSELPEMEYLFPEIVKIARRKPDAINGP